MMSSSLFSLCFCSSTIFTICIVLFTIIIIFQTSNDYETKQKIMNPDVIEFFDYNNKLSKSFNQLKYNENNSIIQQNDNVNKYNDINKIATTATIRDEEEQTEVVVAEKEEEEEEEVEEEEEIDETILFDDNIEMKHDDKMIDVTIYKQVLIEFFNFLKITKQIQLKLKCPLEAIETILFSNIRKLFLNTTELLKMYSLTIQSHNPFQFLKDFLQNSHLSFYYDTFLLYSILIVFFNRYHQAYMDLQHLIQVTNVVFQLDQVFEGDLFYYNNYTFCSFQEIIDMQNVDFVFLNYQLQKMSNNSLLKSQKQQLLTTTFFQSYIKVNQWKLILQKYYFMLKEIKTQMTDLPIIHSYDQKGRFMKEFPKLKKFMYSHLQNQTLIKHKHPFKELKQNNLFTKNRTVLNNKRKLNRSDASNSVQNLSGIKPFNVNNAYKFKKTYETNINKNINKNETDKKNTNRKDTNQFMYENNSIFSYFTPLNFNSQNLFQQCIHPILLHK